MTHFVAFLVGLTLTCLVSYLLSDDTSVATISAVEYSVLFLMGIAITWLLRKFNLLKSRVHPAIIGAVAFMCVVYVTWSVGMQP